MVVRRRHPGRQPLIHGRVTTPPAVPPSGRVTPSIPQTVNVWVERHAVPSGVSYPAPEDPSHGEQADRLGAHRLRRVLPVN